MKIVSTMADFFRQKAPLLLMPGEPAILVTIPVHPKPKQARSLTKQPILFQASLYQACLCQMRLFKNNKHAWETNYLITVIDASARGEAGLIEAPSKKVTFRKKWNLVMTLLRHFSCGWFTLGYLTLAGCTGSTYSGHFDCPLGEGVGCASLSRVNKMIDAREIDLGDDDTSPQKPSADRQVYIYYGPNRLSRIISVPGEPVLDASVPSELVPNVLVPSKLVAGASSSREAND
jgi:hypothetical protein